MNRPIYLDYNATTPVDPRVAEAMIPFLGERFGNASSAHMYGYEAHQAMERARTQVARLIGASPDEVVFTGGGSESDNLAIKGAVFAKIAENPHVVASCTEHSAILNTLSYLARRFGVDVTLVPVDEFGLVSPETVRGAIRPNTVVVSVMHANNETGTIQPVAEISQIARDAGALFHTDAAQSAGKISVSVEDIGADLLTLAGHKIYAPKGIGVLYVRRGVAIDSLVHGSGQEHGLRAGTENVASVVAMGAAAEIAHEDLPEAEPRLRSLRDMLQRLLFERLPRLLLNGHPTNRLPNTLNVSVPDAPGQALLGMAPEVAASTGSACHSGSAAPSGVLMMMGLGAERALGAMRLSVGRWSTMEEMDRAAQALATAAAEVTGVRL